MESFVFQTNDGAKINASKWLVEGKPEAIIILVHGLGEHIGRYEHVANFFNEHHIAVYGFDLRGHGKSSGKRGHIAGEKIFLSDIDSIINFVKKEFPNLPLYLYGHSMGGNMAMDYALKTDNTFKGIICTGPGLGLGDPVPPSKMFIAKVMKSLFPSMIMKNGLDFSNLSHDPKVKEDYLEDPLVHPHVSIKLGLDMFSIGNWVIENGSKWNRPILLMVGTEDHIVSQDKIHQFVENVPNEYLTFKEFTGLYHELHNEYENQQVFNFILDWIHSQN